MLKILRNWINLRKLEKEAPIGKGYEKSLRIHYGIDGSQENASVTELEEAIMEELEVYTRRKINESREKSKSSIPDMTEVIIIK